MRVVSKEGQGAAGRRTKALRYENKLLSGNKQLGDWAGPVPVLLHGSLNLNELYAS